MWEGESIVWRQKGEVDPGGALGTWLSAPHSTLELLPGLWGNWGYWFGSAAPSGPTAQSMRPCLSHFSTKSRLLAWNHLHQQFLGGARLGSREQDGSFLSAWLLGKEGVLCQGQCARAEDSAVLPSEAVPAAAGPLRALVCTAHEWYTCSRHYSILAVGTGVSPVMPGRCTALQIYSLSLFTFSKIPL